MEINRSNELLLKIYVCTCIAAISVSHMRGRSTVPIGTNGTGTHKRKANLSGDLLLCEVWVDHTQSSESRSHLAASRVSRGVISLLCACGSSVLCGRHGELSVRPVARKSNQGMPILQPSCNPLVQPYPLHLSSQPR